jgi:hypothetical protein
LGLVANEMDGDLLEYFPLILDVQNGSVCKQKGFFIYEFLA